MSKNIFTFKTVPTYIPLLIMLASLLVISGPFILNDYIKKKRKKIPSNKGSSPNFLEPSGITDRDLKKTLRGLLWEFRDAMGHQRVIKPKVEGPRFDFTFNQKTPAFHALEQKKYKVATRYLTLRYFWQNE